MATKMTRIMKTSKVNEFRLWGLVLTLAGMGLMILGTAGLLLLGENIGKIVMAIFMVLGLLTMLGSMAIYFWAGMLSTSAIVIDCPECGKQTKLLGKTDRCMYCKTILSLDPSYKSQDQTQDQTQDQAQDQAKEKTGPHS